MIGAGMVVSLLQRRIDRASPGTGGTRRAPGVLTRRDAQQPSRLMPYDEACRRRGGRGRGDELHGRRRRLTSTPQPLSG